MMIKLVGLLDQLYGLTLKMKWPRKMVSWAKFWRSEGTNTILSFGECKIWDGEGEDQWALHLFETKDEGNITNRCICVDITVLTLMRH